MREFRPEDDRAWLSVAGDAQVTRFASWPPLATRHEAAAWIHQAIVAGTQVPRRAFYLAIELHHVGRLIGGAALDVLSYSNRQGEIGYYLHPDRWRQGLGTETARLLLRLAFEELDLHRVQATTDPENVASIKIMERVNMRLEGHLHDRYLLGGVWHDRLLYAITQPEWAADPAA